MEENAQDEKQRLFKLYDELTDAKLQEIADEAPGLTRQPGRRWQT